MDKFLHGQSANLNSGAVVSKFNEFNEYKRLNGTAKDYILLKDLSWRIGKGSSNHIEIIPKGFIFQISSPKSLDLVLQLVLPFLPKRLVKKVLHWLLLPSCVHDWFLWEDYDLAFSSSSFRRAVRAMGAPRWFAIGAYALTLLWTALKRLFTKMAKRLS